MKIGYLQYSPSDEIGYVAQWAAHLLPASWLQTVPAAEPFGTTNLGNLLGKLLLFRQLTEFGVSYHQLPEMIMTDQQPRPRFEDDAYHFDIACANGMVVVAVSEHQEMAVACEEIRPISWKELSSYLSTREWIHITKNNLQSTPLVRSWLTRKAIDRLANQHLKLGIHEVNLDAPTIQTEVGAFHNTDLQLPSRYIGQLLTYQTPLFLEVQNLTPLLVNHLRMVRA